MKSSSLRKLSNFITGRSSIDSEAPSDQQSISPDASVGSAAPSDTNSVPTGSSSASVSVVAGQRAYQAGVDNSAQLLLSVKAPFLETEEAANRPPIDLVAVVDRSGSMSSGNKLGLVKKSLDFLVAQLKGTDRLAIVSFDDKVKTELNITTLNNKGREDASRAITKMNTGGTTNLAGGLMTALNLLKKRDAAAKSKHTAAILLFTDGHANVGLTDTTSILGAMDKEMSDGKHSAAVYTFGYGESHNESMLKAIAESASGLYYSIFQADQIPAAFSDAVGGLLSVSMQNLTLRVECLEGLTIGTFRSNTAPKEVKKGAVFEVEIGDVFSEETKNSFLTLKYPKGAGAGETPALKYSASYFCILDMKQKTIEGTFALNLVDRAPTDEEKLVNEEVEAEAVRWEYLDEVRESQAMANQGDLENAVMKMKKLSNRIGDSVAKDKKVMKRYKAEAEAYVSLMDNAQEWNQVGNKYAEATAYTHQVQRGFQSVACSKIASEELSADVYMNRAKSSMKKKVASFFG